MTAVIMDVFLEILDRPTNSGVVLGMVMLLGPVWIAFFVGLVLGWAWKPRWASLGNCKFDFSAPSSPIKGFGSGLICKTTNMMAASSSGTSQDDKKKASLASTSQVKKEESVGVDDEDMKHLWRLVERRDGGPSWKHMMERSTSDMSYQAWMREPQVGPPQYCSRTVYEDATPELLRDFFWDDEFRAKWDDMLVRAETVEECPTTGTMIVKWIRKFPFFCSDREYIIGRRIWESGRSYFCVTKGVPRDSIPRRDKPRRVDLYYSSWCIRAVESSKNPGQLSACEVILFHHEDMGIPWEIAKFGVRQGMWSAVRKIERGFRSYQKSRASDQHQLSNSAFMAQINTKIDPEYLKSLDAKEEGSSETEELAESSDEKQKGMNLPKLLLLGGVAAVVCSLDRGLITKAVIFSVAKRFANVGRGACPSRTAT